MGKPILDDDDEYFPSNSSSSSDIISLAHMYTEKKIIQRSNKCYKIIH